MPLPADEAVQAARAALSSVKLSSDTTGFEAGKEVMEKLRNLHMVLGSTMESMLQVREAVCSWLWAHTVLMTAVHSMVGV